MAKPDMEQRSGDRENPGTECNRDLEKLRQKKVKRNLLILVSVSLFIVGCVIWSVYDEASKSQAQREQEKQDRIALVRPYERTASQKYLLKDSAETTVKEFIPSATPTVEIESINLIVFIKTSDFRSIPASDQPKLVKALADRYCKTLSSIWAEIKIKDVGTGQTLDSKSCPMKNGGINPN